MKKIIAVVLATLILFSSCATTQEVPSEASVQSDHILVESNNVSEPPNEEVVDDMHTSEEQDAFEIFSTLNEQALSIMFWYFADTAEDLDIATESEYAPYYKVGKFSSIDEMKTATDEIFTSTFTENMFYDHAFAQIADDFYMYKEIDGELYRNIDSGGFGWLYESTDEYYVPYLDNDKIIIAVKNFLPENEETWVNFLLRNENGIWKLDTYYQFNPYIDNEEIIASGVSSWFCAQNWTGANELNPNALISFYIYTYLFNITEEYDYTIGYEVPSTEVLEGLSVYLKGLKLETLTAINEHQYASATYNDQTDCFYFEITFDPADFIVTSSEVNNGITTLEVTIIGKSGTAAYYGYLDLEIDESGLRFIENNNGRAEADGLVVPKRLCKPPKWDKLKATLEVLLCQEKTGKITASCVK